jgi:hypothetical protein
MVFRSLTVDGCYGYGFREPTRQSAVPGVGFQFLTTHALGPPFCPVCDDNLCGPSSKLCSYPES